MEEDIYHGIEQCPDCGVFFIEAIGETCRCPDMEPEPENREMLANLRLKGN
jgi:hypothetical protein